MTKPDIRKFSVPKPSSAEGLEHVQDRIEALLKRATTLAATDQETYAHLQELNAINEEVQLVELHLQEVRSQSVHLGALSQRSEYVAQSSNEAYPKIPNRENPVGRGPKQTHNHLRRNQITYDQFIPTTIGLTQLEVQRLVHSAVCVRNNLLSIKAQVREYADICGGPESTYAFSHGLAYQLIELTGTTFPDVQGRIYQKKIEEVSINPEVENLRRDCTVILLDYGTELYHYADRGTDQESMYPMASALAHMLSTQINDQFILKEDLTREKVNMLLYEPARCFYVALGKATNKNPILLQKLFRTMALEMVSLQPYALREGSPTRDPLMSVLEYGQYVDHSVLSFIPSVSLATIALHKLIKLSLSRYVKAAWAIVAACCACRICAVMYWVSWRSDGSRILYARSDVLRGPAGMFPPKILIVHSSLL